MLLAVEPLLPQSSPLWAALLAIVSLRRHHQLPVHHSRASASRRAAAFPALSLLGEFLLKDIPLLGLSFWTLADAIRATQQRSNAE